LFVAFAGKKQRKQIAKMQQIRKKSTEKWCGHF